MSALRGKHILLGVSGGIAAYKSAYLVRLLVKKEAEVKVVLTPYAEEFVTPLTISTLSKNPVFSSFTDQEKNWNNHVELGEWADLMIIAPLTANTLSKMVHGKADNLLLTTYLSATCPVFVAPAMDLDMYKHHSTQENLSKLAETGHHVIEPGTGELASGLMGKGRMEEPEQIVQILEDYFLKSLPLIGKKVLITAGPTYEAIDPVRFIGNHSSGKMGYALANEALKLGAEVYLISGPTHLALDHSKLKLFRVVTAQDMLDKALKYYPDADIAIAAAAVSDYRPKKAFNQKIKKQSDTLHVELVKNPDILKRLGDQKHKQILVGFALETDNEEENARHKLKQKNLDFIVLNSLKDKGAGFKSDTNKISIITNDEICRFDVKPKSEVATDIFKKILNKLNALK